MGPHATQVAKRKGSKVKMKRKNVMWVHVVNTY